MEHLLNINKTLNILLKNQFTQLQQAGDIANNINFSQWVDYQGIIVEPAISWRVKDVVFHYLTNREEYAPVRQQFRNIDELIRDNNPPRRAIEIKQVSIYFYSETFGPKFFSLLEIGILHNTTKQNVHKTLNTIRGWIDTDKRFAQQITEITEIINTHKNNNTLKIA